MICHARIETARRADGSTSLPTLASSPPLRLMPTPDGVYIVGAAAAPLNGDRLALDLKVEPGTELTVRTVAASLAWPGTSPVASQFLVRASVGAGASLNWLPEPIVPVAGCVHRMTAEISLAEDASLHWREEIVFGRHNERPGELSSHTCVTRDGRSVLRQETVVGASSFDTPPQLAQMGAVGNAVLVRKGLAETPSPVVTDAAECAALELEDGGVQVVAAAGDAVALRKLLDQQIGLLDGSRQTQSESQPKTFESTRPRSEHAQPAN